MSYKTAHLYRGIEQLVARRPHESEVVGSIPTPATIKTHTAIFSYEKIFSSLVEHLSVKQKVVGSNPTKYFLCVLFPFLLGEVLKLVEEVALLTR